jgi:hypothetical protein
MSSPSSQLNSTLLSSLTATLSHAPPRPLVHHLNADSSWLLQLPCPHWATTTREKQPLGRERLYYNVLIDPWLQGPQSDVANWFSQQWHAVDSKFRSIHEVEELAWRLEELASRPGEDDDEALQNPTGRSRESVENGKTAKGQMSRSSPEAHGISSPIDAVVVSHEFTDHCHRETLLEIRPTVPVFASSKAAALIRSWKHFALVVDLPVFTSSHTDWRQISTGPLPAWISLSRLTDEADALYYHSAVLIAFSSTAPPPPSPSRKSSSKRDALSECIIYTPHGISSAALTPLLTASPPLQTLCFIHGLHDVSLSRVQQLNLGAHSGLKAQRLLRAKYWVGTHDEVKKGGGLVGWFLQRKPISVEEALREEKRRLEGEGEEEGVLADLDEVSFEEVGNGESRLLQ